MNNNLDYAKVFETLINETEKYLQTNKLNAMILGISGGLDSTVTAAICYEVEKRNPNIKFIGVSLPCSSNSNEENDSADICMKAFCKPGNYWTENLQKEYMLMKSTCELHSNSTYISQGNIKARLRMIYLYNLASTMGGIVMDTDNLTEHYLGFFTIHGDVADFNPIGGLWKHEVYGLVRWLHDEYYQAPFGPDGDRHYALECALNITPTDGNGVNNLGDMGQIAPAFAYDNNIEAYTKVDDIIQTYLEYQGHHPEEYQITMEELHKKYDIDNDEVTYHTVDDIINRINRTEYKRKQMPIRIERNKYCK